MNKAMLMGNIGKDPELKFTPSKLAVCELSIATTESVKKGEGQYEKVTEWHKVVFFGKRADIVANYCKKGDKLLVEGKIKTNTYEKDGQKKYFTTIVADNFEFCGGKQKTSEDSLSSEAQESPHFTTSDIPF